MMELTTTVFGQYQAKCHQKQNLKAQAEHN